MGNIKEMNIKNRTYYFFSNMINIEDFDSNLLKIDKKSHKNVGIYNIGYITVKKVDYYANIHSVNPLYLIIGKVDRHIEFSSVECNSIEEKNGSKYLVFDSTDENKEVLKKYKESCDGIKNDIETINGGKEGEYGKDFMKIKFDTDDDLPLNKQLNIPTMAVVARSVFEEDGEFYPQIYLDECLCEL